VFAFLPDHEAEKEKSIRAFLVVFLPGKHNTHTLTKPFLSVLLLKYQEKNILHVKEKMYAFD